MAQPITSVLWNPQILINSVDLSGKARKMNISTGQDKKEVSAFGHTTHNFLPSLKTDTADVEFYIDRATGGVIQTLRALVTGPGSTAGMVAISARSLNSAATTSNEVYSMTAMIDGGLPLISGAIGDAETMNVKFASCSSTGWAVATTS